jgi:hypothetical protein
VDRAGRGPARVVCQARGLADKREHEHHEPLKLFEV